MELIESLTIKIILIAVSTTLGLILGLLASLMIENGEWDKLSNRTKWGHRLIGVGISITVSIGFFAANTEVSEQKIWLLLGAVSITSFSGMQGYKMLIKQKTGGE